MDPLALQKYGKGVLQLIKLDEVLIHANTQGWNLSLCFYIGQAILGAVSTINRSGNTGHLFM